MRKDESQAVSTDQDHLELFLQALRDTENWFDNGDAIDGRISLAMQYLMSRIIAIRASGEPACKRCHGSLGNGISICLGCMMAEGSPE